MKTPSFGNNSGPDDHFSMFRTNERREKEIDISSSNTMRIQDRNCTSNKEIELVPIGKKERLSDSNLKNDLVKYANKMGHKKSTQKFKKDGQISKIAISQYLKPKITGRNQQDKLSNDLKANKTFVESHNYEKFDANDEMPLMIPEIPIKNNDESKQFIFNTNDSTKKFIGGDYSTEKAKYIKPEFNSFTSKADSNHNSINDSVHNRTKDEYALYIDRPFNSIDESSKRNNESSEIISNRDIICDQDAASSELNQEINFSGDTKPKKLVAKKSSRSRSKIAAIISKEYKEDLIDSNDNLKLRLGHSNSFESKVNEYNQTNPKVLINNKTNVESLNPTKDNKINKGKFDFQLGNQEKINLEDYQDNNDLLIMPNKRFSAGTIKIEDNRIMFPEKDINQNYANTSKNQTKYIKNIDLPAMINHKSNTKKYYSLADTCKYCGLEINDKESHVCYRDSAGYEDSIIPSGIISYNDNNLLEIQMEKEQSKSYNERLLNNRYNKAANKDLTHLILTAEDKVRIKKYDSKDNFLPVYDDRIEEDKDEDNYTSNLDSPSTMMRNRVSANILPGCAFEVIIEYLGYSTDVYCLSKTIFENVLKYKIEVHGSQQEILVRKLNEFKIELEYLKTRDNYCMSKNLRIEFESDACREDWDRLIEASEERQLSPKDMVVLKLYFTFMGIEL